MANRRVFLARNRKTGFHSVFEVVPSGYEHDIKGVLDPDVLNSLVLWRSFEELASALEKTGPLVSFDVYKGTGRFISISEAIEVAEAKGRGEASGGYCENDESLLYLQFYLDGQNGGQYLSKPSISRAVQKYGLLESDAASDLRAWAEKDPGAMVAIEPLADLTFMRNYGSIMLRLLANYRKEGTEAVLEESGFVHVERNMKFWSKRTGWTTYYTIPFFHNTADDLTVNFSFRWAKNIAAYTLVDPLKQLIYSLEASDVKKQFGLVENASVFAPPQITGERRPVFNARFDYESADTRMYLAIRDDVSQKEAVEQFFYATVEMFSNLKSKNGENLGWELSRAPGLLEDEGPQVVFHTLASAIVGSLVFREGVVPSTCKFCGNGMLVKTKGKRREFCSDSCRSQQSALNSSRNDNDSAK